jgi:hypothetical protein
MAVFSGRFFWTGFSIGRGITVADVRAALYVDVADEAVFGRWGKLGDAVLELAARLKVAVETFRHIFRSVQCEKYPVVSISIGDCGNRWRDRCHQRSLGSYAAGARAIIGSSESLSMPSKCRAAARTA